MRYILRFWALPACVLDSLHSFASTDFANLLLNPAIDKRVNC